MIGASMKSELHRSDIEQAREGVKEFLERRCFSTETEREIKAALETDPLKALETALQARNN